MKEGWEYKTLGECCRITDFVSNGSFASLKQNVNYYYMKMYTALIINQGRLYPVFSN